MNKIFWTCLLTVCFAGNPALAARSESDATETPVQMITLVAPLNLPEAEFSGLTWCQDHLVLLPQYPDFAARAQMTNPGPFTERQGDTYLYLLSKQQISEAIRNPQHAPLEATPVVFNETDVRARIAGFEGFEAIVCDGDHAWLTVERKEPSWLANVSSVFAYHGAVVLQAKILFNSEQPSITILNEPLIYTGSQSELFNASDEALTQVANQLLSIHEVNGSTHVENPRATIIDPASGALSKIAFPRLPFRVTDATSVDAHGRFWVINYHWQGDQRHARTNDPIATLYGQGLTHQQRGQVERLLELQITDDAIELSGAPPIQLELGDDKGRNWEGIARLQTAEYNGFLLITDKFPQTLFGFVPLPE